MATIRNTKKQITYLTEEVISDCYLAIYFQGEQHKDALLKIIDKAVENYNSLIHRVNNPSEKHNPRLLRKHYAQIEKDMFTTIDDLFEQISTVCKA